MVLGFSEVLIKVLQPYSGFNLSLEATRDERQFYFQAQWILYPLYLTTSYLTHLFPFILYHRSQVAFLILFLEISLINIIKFSMYILMYIWYISMLPNFLILYQKYFPFIQIPVTYHLLSFESLLKPSLKLTLKLTGY